MDRHTVLTSHEMTQVRRCEGSRVSVTEERGPHLSSVSSFHPFHKDVWEA